MGERRGRPAVCLVAFQPYPGHPQVRRDSEVLAEAGCDVTLVVRRLPGQPLHERHGHLDVYRLPIVHRRAGWLRYVWEYALFLLLAFVAVTLLHLRRRFRAVEVMGMPDLLVFSALAPKLSGAQVVLYMLDTMPEIMAVSRNLRPCHPVVRLLALEERLGAALADCVIVTQETARRAVAGRGTPERKITVVLNCPIESVFTPEMADRRDRRSGSFEILTHGTILERWGNQVLIEALPLIARNIPEARATIIGQGEYLSVLQELARERGVADRVEFPGWVPVEDLPQHIRRADVGYVGVLFGMALSNKLLEYAALRLAVVVTRWPTHLHYFPEDTATYFKSGDAHDLAAAVVTMYHDPERARERADRAERLYRERYRWSVQQQTYLGVYAELLGGPLGRSSGSTRQQVPVSSGQAPDYP